MQIIEAFWFCRPSLPILLPAANGQGLQISAQLVRRDGKVFYNLILENNTQNSLDGFMIQFNKNTFGLAAGGPLQIPELLPGTTRKALLPMVMFQNMAPGSPNSLLQVAVKNNQQPVWYFNDRISLFVLFTEDGKMERDIFLEVGNFIFSTLSCKYPDSMKIVIADMEVITGFE